MQLHYVTSYYQNTHSLYTHTVHLSSHSSRHGYYGFVPPRNFPRGAGKKISTDYLRSGGKHWL